MDTVGTLFVVGTPIGNLSDVTARARETLSAVDAVLCEDTRVTSRLMAALGIGKTLISFHQHTGASKTDALVRRLKAGESFALVTDAGTPGISDPGGMLVEAVVDALGDAAKVVPIPGPSAVIAALSISGFPSDRFAFLGFPPHKKGRQTYFRELAEMDGTVVFYESTHRIMKCLEEMGGLEGLAGRRLVVCRELTKLHETVYRGTPAQVTEMLKATSIRGEFVVVVGPA